MKHKKIIIGLLGLVLTGTVLLMLADQAVGSCCGASEQAKIEVWWWLIIGLQIGALYYVYKRK